MELMPDQLMEKPNSRSGTRSSTAPTNHDKFMELFLPIGG
jgi:hypothetical protein